MAAGQVQQTNLVVNQARHLIYVEEDNLAYNYKTRQWSLVTAWDGNSFFSVNSKYSDIGLVRLSAGSADLQLQATTDDAQTAIWETGSVDPNTGGRSVVTGVRPLMNKVLGGTTTVRVGVQDTIGTAVSYSTATSLNSRTNMANMRQEGRYFRTEVTVAGGFDNFLGADIDVVPAGGV